MPEPNVRFVSLADAMRPHALAPQPVPVPEPALPDPAGTSVCEIWREGEAGMPIPSSAETVSAIREARLMRAALGDALAAILADLLQEIAVEVVARELRLAEPDITAIVGRLMAERLSAEPVRLRVAPLDAGVVCDLPVLADPGLQPGDAILECREGSIDARLGVRLAAVLGALQL